MSFTQLETCLANTKIWKKDLKDDKAPETIEALFSWLQGQLLHNVAPLLEAQVKANMHELGETYEALEELDGVIGEMVDKEGDFLQPEMASDLTATLILGMFIVDTISLAGIKLEDELTNKRLQDAMKLYRQNTTILLEQIKAVTVEDDEDEEEGSDDDDTDTDTDDENDIIHGQGESSGGSDGGGAGTPGDDAGAGGDGGGSGDRSIDSGGLGILTPTGTESGEGTKEGA